MSTTQDVDGLRASGIYAIVCLASGRRYIGQAADFKQRWRQHRKDLRAHVHHNLPLQRTFDKYGESSLLFITLELCVVKDLLHREQSWIDSTPLDLRLNLCPAAGSCRGYKQSQEVIERKRKVHLGKKRSPETRLRMKWSPAQRQKMLAILRGRKGIPCSPEVKERLRQFNLGKRHTLETRIKMSLAHKGKKFTPEHIKNRADSYRGYRHTEEAKRKISAARKMRISRG